MRYYKEVNNEVIFFEGNVLTTEDGVIINPTEENLLANGWLIWIDTEDELLIQAKQNKLADIDDFDSSLEMFTINGEQMWLGHELRQQLKTSVEAYISSGITTVTKWFNGQEFIFPTNIWLQMLAELEIYAAEVLNTTEQHKAEVNALSSVEDVENYDIADGYPAPLLFTQQWLQQHLK